MKRKLFLILIIFYIKNLFAGLIIGPYLQNVTHNSITIIWETNTEVSGLVKYGLLKDSLINSVNEDKAKKLHKITLTNLSPHQTYYYQCEWDNESTSIEQFTTAPLDCTTPIRFMIYGDSRNNPIIHQQILESAMNFNPNVILNTGDLVDDGREYAFWKSQLFDPAKKQMMNIPYYTVPGNHEEESSYFYDYFSIYQDKKWWSTDYGCIHLIGLNSNIDSDPNSEQYQWLEQDLKANEDKPWIIVLFHHPLFHVHPNRKIYDIRYYWHPLFMKYGVDLVFNGHDHYYLRTYPIGRMSNTEQAVVYFTVAGGGAPLYKGVDRPYAARYESCYHYAILNITEQEIIVNTYKTDGENIDHFAVNQYKNFFPSQFIEYGIYELENQLIHLLGNFYPQKIAPNLIAYDTTFSVKPNFNLPISCQINWQTSNQWHIRNSESKVNLEPDDSLKISLEATAPEDKLLPTPILKLHLQVNDSLNQTNFGFINQDIEISFEKAAFNRAMASNMKNIDPIFNFIKYYEKSNYMNRVVMELCRLTERNPDPKNLEKVKNILDKDFSYINQFRYYPVFFIFNDFSHWNEWLAVIKNLPGDQKKDVPGFLFYISFMENLHMKFVREWAILGTFDSNLDNNFTPERELNFDKTYIGLENKEISWRRVSSDNDNFLDLQQQFDSLSRGAVFAHAKVKAKRSGKILLLLGNSSDIVLWVNNVKVFQKKANREPEFAQEVLTIDVQKGTNNILIKSSTRQKEWGIYLQVIDKNEIIENIRAFKTM